MPNDAIKIPLDVFPEEVQSAIREIDLDTGLSPKQKQENIDNISLKALQDPAVCDKVRENLILKYPELMRQIRPDTEIEAKENYSIGSGPLALILIFLVLLRYPITWIILGILLIAYLASLARC